MSSTPRPSRRLRRSRVVRRAAILGAALTLAVPAAAQAAAQVYDDKQGDVTTFKALPKGTSETVRTSLDIDKVTIGRGKRTVVVRVYLREALPRTSGKVVEGVELRTVFRRNGAKKDTIQYSYWANNTGIGLANDCNGVEDSGSASADTVTFVYPRYCFGGADTAVFSIYSVLSDNGTLRYAHDLWRRDSLFAGHRV